MSGESSFRIQSKAHRERSQPANRKKFGFLEKHKDYIERSTDYKKKQKLVKTLKSKANERNPDEFYYNMHKSQVVDGIHTKLINNSLDPDTIKLLKTQDLNYILHKKSIDDKKVDKLKSTLHLIHPLNTNHSRVTRLNETKSHIVFIDKESNESSSHPSATTVSEVAISSSPSSSSSSINLAPLQLNLKLLPSSSPKMPLSTPPATTKQSNKKSTNTSTKTNEKKLINQTKQSYKELNRRILRSKQLTAAMTELTLQRQLMGKGTKRKLTITDNVTNKEVTVYKWKRERRR